MIWAGTKRMNQPAPTEEGWFYARKKGRHNDKIEPVDVCDIGPRPLSCYWKGSYMSVMGFDWFGPVDLCEEVKTDG